MNSLKTYLFFLLIISSFIGKSQLLDSIANDTVKTYYSLEEALKQPDKVYKLELRKEKLTEFPKEIFLFKNLNSLNISKNKIPSLPKEIGTLTNLQYLDISLNDIDTLPNEIGNLIHLKELIINRIDITYLPTTIGNLNQLEYLDAWGTFIEYFPDEMKKMSSLKKLDIRVVNIYRDEKLRLKEMLPNTKIYYDKGCDCGKK